MGCGSSRQQANRNNRVNTNRRLRPGVELGVESDRSKMQPGVRISGRNYIPSEVFERTETETSSSILEESQNPLLPVSLSKQLEQLEDFKRAGVFRSEEEYLDARKRIELEMGVISTEDLTTAEAAAAAALKIQETSYQVVERNVGNSSNLPVGGTRADRFQSRLIDFDSYSSSGEESSDDEDSHIDRMEAVAEGLSQDAAPELESEAVVNITDEQTPEKEKHESKKTPTVVEESSSVALVPTLTETQHMEGGPYVSAQSVHVDSHGSTLSDPLEDSSHSSIQSNQLEGNLHLSTQKTTSSDPLEDSSHSSIQSNQLEGNLHLSTQNNQLEGSSDSSMLCDPLEGATPPSPIQRDPPIVSTMDGSEGQTTSGYLSTPEIDEINQVPFDNVGEVEVAILDVPQEAIADSPLSAGREVKLERLDSRNSDGDATQRSSSPSRSILHRLSAGKMGSMHSSSSVGHIAIETLGAEELDYPTVRSSGGNQSELSKVVTGSESDDILLHSVESGRKKTKSKSKKKRSKKVSSKTLNKLENGGSYTDLDIANALPLAPLENHLLELNEEC